MIKKVLDRIGVDQMYSVLYTFLLRFYKDEELSKKGKVFQYLYKCFVVFDLLESKGIDWFLDSEFNTPKFYDAIAFFDKESVEKVQKILNKKDWAEEEYNEWYIIADAVQDKASMWVMTNSNLFKDYSEKFEAIYMEQVEIRKEIKESSDELRNNKNET
ncbi:hypothetical protein [Aquimarina sp. 2201CG5-10]|uniref:hypothetical protein n=1 Tax=Aquimarina callyspongiae TaxID=3098150 RepID=UPI002AB37216|nr:hypothetical protein [Aquimarina sp. 2201CG5-10]MDY8138080.1 hypothetical protein [Aquimarina sp. 2201CG5-10]